MPRRVSAKARMENMRKLRGLQLQEGVDVPGLQSTAVDWNAHVIENGMVEEGGNVTVQMMAEYLQDIAEIPPHVVEKTYVSADGRNRPTKKVFNYKTFQTSEYQEQMLLSGLPVAMNTAASATVQRTKMKLLQSHPQTAATELLLKTLPGLGIDPTFVSRRMALSRLFREQIAGIVERMHSHPKIIALRKMLTERSPLIERPFPRKNEWEKQSITFLGSDVNLLVAALLVTREIIARGTLVRFAEGDRRIMHITGDVRLKADDQETSQGEVFMTVSGNCVRNLTSMVVWILTGDFDLAEKLPGMHLEHHGSDQAAQMWVPETLTVTFETEGGETVWSVGEEGPTFGGERLHAMGEPKFAGPGVDREGNRIGGGFFPWNLRPEIPLDLTLLQITTPETIYLLMNDAEISAPEIERSEITKMSLMNLHPDCFLFSCMVAQNIYSRIFYVKASSAHSPEEVERGRNYVRQDMTMQIMDAYFGRSSPWIPNSLISEIADKTKRLFKISHYNSEDRLPGNVRVSQFPADEKKVLPAFVEVPIRLGRVENHYVYDGLLPITRFFVENMDRLVEVAGDKYPLPILQVATEWTNAEKTTFRVSKHLGTLKSLVESKWESESMLNRMAVVEIVMEKAFKAGTSTKYGSFHTGGSLLATLFYGGVSEKTASLKRKRNEGSPDGKYSAADVEAVVGPDHKFFVPMTSSELAFVVDTHAYFKDAIDAREIPMDTFSEEALNRLFAETCSRKKKPSKGTPYLLGDPWGLNDIAQLKTTGWEYTCSEAKQQFHILSAHNPFFQSRIPFHVRDIPLNDRCTYGQKPASFKPRDPFVRSFLQKRKAFGKKFGVFNIPVDYTVVAFDFETITDRPDEEGHVTYGVAASWYEHNETGAIWSARDPDLTPSDMFFTKKRRCYIGPECGQDLCDFIITKFKDLDVLMVAHNLHYDLSKLAKSSLLDLHGGVFKSVNKTNSADGSMYHSNDEAKEKPKLVRFIDSMAFLTPGTTLAKFGKMYKLPIAKEVLPHGIFKSRGAENTVACESHFCERCGRYDDESSSWRCGIANGHLMSLDTAVAIHAHDKGLTDEGEIAAYKTELHEAIIRSGIKTREGEGSLLFNPIDYAAYYCIRDCEVLLDAFLAHRRVMYNIPMATGEKNPPPCSIDIFHCCSVPQFASIYLAENGALEETYEYSGFLRSYIQGAVVGGRVMIAGNTPVAIRGLLADYDAASLYPSAMKYISDRLGGLPLGIPKVIPKGNLNNDFLDDKESNHYYVVSVKITGVKTKRAFPVLSVKDEAGKRLWDNDAIIGQTIRMDKITWEDAREFQGITGEVVCGVYWPKVAGVSEEITGKLGKCMDELKRLRDEEKKKDKDGPSQNAIKLLMNSGYGRFVMKPIKTSTKFINTRAAAVKEFAVNGDSIEYFQRVRDDLYIFNVTKSINNHFSAPHIGAMILSVSKRIMNKVMCTAEDKGIPIYYQDTDSMQILVENVPKLEKAYADKYGGEVLRGEEFGQFHSDWEKVDGYDSDKTVGLEGYYIAKKLYAVYLQYTPKDANSPLMHKWHVRTKGIPEGLLEKECKAQFPGARLGGIPEGIRAITDKEGKGLTIDLLDGGARVRFAGTKDFRTLTVKSFTRKVHVPCPLSPLSLPPQ